MPRSYLASKPAPNPQLSGFLIWTKSDFAAILADSNKIAALAGIDREHELVVIYRPLPMKSPAGDLIAIAGNMSNELSEPAFIKINEDLLSKIIWKFLWRSAPRFPSPLNYFAAPVGMRHPKKLHSLFSPTWSRSHSVQSFLK